MTSAAERQRRARERRKKGRIVVSFEVNHEEAADWLHGLGLLELWDAEEPDKLSEALAEHVWKSSHA